MVSVLFVCMGNICRSPMSEGIFRHTVVKRGVDPALIHIDSAGTIGYHAGNPPDRRAQATCMRAGIDLSSQRSRKVTDQDFEDFDYILCADRDNLADLRARAPGHLHHKITLLLGFGSGLGTSEIPDPYYGRDDGFEYCLDLISNAAEGLLDHIDREHLAK